jgi:hypothetical protein
VEALLSRSVYRHCQIYLSSVSLCIVVWRNTHPRMYAPGSKVGVSLCIGQFQRFDGSREDRHWRFSKKLKCFQYRGSPHCTCCRCGHELQARKVSLRDDYVSNFERAKSPQDFRSLRMALNPVFLGLFASYFGSILWLFGLILKSLVKAGLNAQKISSGWAVGQWKSTTFGLLSVVSLGLTWYCEIV